MRYPILSAARTVPAVSLVSSHVPRPRTGMGLPVCSVMLDCGSMVEAHIGAMPFALLGATLDFAIPFRTTTNYRMGRCRDWNKVQVRCLAHRAGVQCAGVNSAAALYAQRPRGGPAVEPGATFTCTRKPTAIGNQQALVAISKCSFVCPARLRASGLRIRKAATLAIDTFFDRPRTELQQPARTAHVRRHEGEA